MKKPCRDIRDLLVPFMDGELSEEDGRRVADHLAQCPDCRHELASLQAVDEIVREKDAAPVLADDYWDWHRNQVWKRIRASRHERRERGSRQRFLWFRMGTMAAGAAVVVIAVVAGWRLIQTGERQPVAPMRFAAPAETEELAAHEEVPVTGSKKGVARGGTVSDLDRTGGEEVTAAADGWMADEEARVAGEVTELPAATAGRAAERRTVPADRLEAADESEDARAAARTRTAVGGVTAAEGEETRAVMAAKSDGDFSRLPVESPAAAGFMTLPAESCEQAPEVVDMPVLPKVMLEDTATVLVRALVEPDGSVSETELERSSGVELLDGIAKDNVRQARFRPGYNFGEPVRCWTSVEQNFEADLEADAVLDTTPDAAGDRPVDEIDGGEDEVEPGDGE